MSVTQAIPNIDETFSELCSDMLTIVRDEERSCSVGDKMDRYYGFGAGQRLPWPPQQFRIRVVGRLTRSGYTLRKFVTELKRQTNDMCLGPFGILETFAECLEDPSC